MQSNAYGHYRVMEMKIEELKEEIEKLETEIIIAILLSFLEFFALLILIANK